MGFEQLELNTYLFTPLYEPSKDTLYAPYNTLTVYKGSGQLQLNAPSDKAIIEKQLTVYGILGFIELSAGEAMIVITGCRKVGTIFNEIFQATGFQILPISALSQEDDQLYIPLLKEHLAGNNFYFSYKYNITLSIQKQLVVYKSIGLDDWRQADERFFWNKHLCTKIIEACRVTQIENEFARFILPVIQGFVSIQNTAINHKSITFALISRRSSERAGTRYFSRGLDQYGNSSNFVETEQVLLYEESLNSTQFNCFSYIQTRGSIPAIWRQIPNMRYTPQLWINPDFSQTIEASRAHFEKQISHYGPQILVNLVNKKGYESWIGKLYSVIVEQLQNSKLKYIHFDFHYQCKNTKWNRVQLLIDQLEEEIKNQGFCLYRIASESSLKRLQKSVIRTNCMDCLDRTNVVQSALGRYVLTEQLRHIGVLQATEIIENDDQFFCIFKNMWADNANALSVSYSGTNALKTDITRNGTRNYKGVFSDIYYSFIRYFKNNYRDGSRQDGIDLILGLYQVKINVPPLRNNSFGGYVLLYFVLALFAFLLLLLNPHLVSTTLLWIFLLSLSLAVILSCALFVQYHGAELVDWPTLIPLAKTEGASLSMYNLNSSSNTELGYEMPTLKKKT